MNEWRCWWLWKWALATQERDFHSWGLKHFAETALSADSFQSFMHNLMHFFHHFTDRLDFPLPPFVTSQPCSRWLSRWWGGSCWRWWAGWPGWPGPWSRGGRRWRPWWPCWSGRIKHCNESTKKIYNQRYSKILKPKVLKPKIFKDVQRYSNKRYSNQIYSRIFKPKIFKDIQRHSHHLEECLGHRLAKYVSRYTAVHT